MVYLRTTTCKAREACYDQGNKYISIKKTMPPASSRIENEGGERRKKTPFFFVCVFQWNPNIFYSITKNLPFLRAPDGERLQKRRSIPPPPVATHTNLFT